MMKNDRIQISVDKPKLLLVEGSSDKAFFTSLIDIRKIEGFDIFTPGDIDPKYKLGGEDAIIILLNNLAIHKNFNLVKKIIIVVDADLNSNKKLDKFNEILLKNNNKPGNIQICPSPDKPNTFVISETGSLISILTLPLSESEGAMETLCWRAALTVQPKADNCISNFAKCVGTDTWSPQKRDKFNLRSYISMNCEANPDLPTTSLWESYPLLVPLDSNVFDTLATYLSEI